MVERAVGKPGRVAIVRHGTYPGQPHLKRDVRALRNAGFHVDVICDSERAKRHLETVDGITVIRVPLQHKRGGKGRYLFEYTAMPALAAGALALGCFRGRYDYVEIDTMPDWLLAAAIVPKLIGSRVVLYMFENMAELLATDNNLSHRHPLVRLLNGIELTCARLADRVMTPYEKARQRLIAAGIEPEKVVFIANGPDEDVFLEVLQESGVTAHASEEEAHLALPLGSELMASSHQLEEIHGSTERSAGLRSNRGKLRLVTHGSLLERYGIETLLEAMVLLRNGIPDVSLDIIGSGEYEGRLREIATDLGLTDLVRFVGPVDHGKMAAHLTRADIGVVPYWVDGMPNKLMEYLLLEIPAVVADWPTMRLYFGDDALTYVEPRNARALAAAIAALHLDPKRRRKQAETAREQYLSRLAWSRSKRDYLGVYGVASDAGSDEPARSDNGTQETSTASINSQAQPAGNVFDWPHQSSGNWISFVLRQSRGPRNALSRLPTIAHRFGWRPDKSIANLETILGVLDRYSLRATMPITAVTARRNPDVVMWLRDRGVEVAAHGYVHNDYTALDRGEQLTHVTRARDELASLGIPVQGWRCPYSRWNGHTLEALTAAGFDYDATPVYAWPAFDQERIFMTAEARLDYERVRRLFRVRDASGEAVLPRTCGRLIQIPMSIPQDEDMVDRLHLDADQMSSVWLRMLNESRDRGDVFVICLHPERAALFSEPLERVVEAARRFGDVWFPTLCELAEWWRERGQIRLDIKAAPNERTRGSPRQIRVAGSSRAAVRCNGRTVMGPGLFELDGEAPALIACGDEWPDQTVSRLQEAGYIVSCARSHPTGSALDLSDLFTPNTHPDEIVRRLAGPGNDLGPEAAGRTRGLVRLEPWPAGYRSCFSATADVDALTLFDFAMRLKEFS